MSIIARNKEKLKQLFLIENPVEQGVPKVLSIQIGPAFAAYCVTDRSGNRLEELGYYLTDCRDAESLEAFLSGRPAFGQSYYEVMLAYDFPESTLVPALEYRHEEAGSLAASLFGRAAAANTVAEAIRVKDMYNVYTVPQDIMDVMKNRFPAAKTRHQYSVLLEKAVPPEGDSILLDVRDSEFSLLLTRQGEVLLAQTYSYSSPEDVLYYLVRAASAFDMSREQCSLLVSGLIDQQSSLYKELYLYFIRISFREATWSHQEYPLHFFTTLNDIARCAS